MKILKPKFWNSKKNLFSILLWPFSILFYLVTILRKSFTSSTKFKTPIICIGNIHVGGTGKNPVSIEIFNILKTLKKNPAIIRKFYINHEDEHLMIKDKTNSLILGNNRIQAIRKAEKENFQVLVLDDGFQDHTIHKDLNIICFHGNQMVGNEFLFPAGPLRDSLDSLKRSQILIINGNRNKDFEKKIFNISKNIKIFYSKYVPKNIDQFKNKNIFAFAGIGNPNNFFDLLSKYGFNIRKKIALPDHHALSEKELNKIINKSIKNNLEIITTEKDYFRYKDYGLSEIKCIKLNLEIFEKDKLINEIRKYI